MKNPWTHRDTKIIFWMVAFGIALFYAGTHDLRAVMHQPLPTPGQDYLWHLRPRLPADAFEYRGVIHTGPITVAKVFGRSHGGCQDATPAFITKVSAAAVLADVDPGVFASMISTESGCNQWAVSNRGAIGYTQVVPALHQHEYDFTRVNPFNPDDNLRVGAEILAANIKTFGTTNGVARYQGLATTCDADHHCNPQYTNSVLGLAKGLPPTPKPAPAPVN